MFTGLRQSLAIWFPSCAWVTQAGNDLPNDRPANDIKIGFCQLVCGVLGKRHGFSGVKGKIPTMNPGKAIKQDPRSAPDKAPAEAPDVMSKNMPEFPMDKNELQYPGGAGHVASHNVGNAPHQRDTPAHPMEPPTELPRMKTHLLPTELHTLGAVLDKCILACEQCVNGCEKEGGEKSHGCVVNASSCGEVCTVLRNTLHRVEFLDAAILAKDLAPVCARACEACAKECNKHPDMAHCTECAQACRDCAAECRQFAR